MNDVKYIGTHVHQLATLAAFLGSTGKLSMESTFETKASKLLAWDVPVRLGRFVSE